MATTKQFEYSAKMTELEDTLAQLQQPDISLDTAMKLHESGRKLIQELETFLKTADNEVKKHLAKEK